MIKPRSFLFFLLLSTFLVSADQNKEQFNFRIRTITAGVTLNNLADLATIYDAIDFLKQSRQFFTEKGYEVQTIRLSTQHLHELVEDRPDQFTIDYFKKIDAVLVDNNVVLAVGELLEGDQHDAQMADWVIRLIKATQNISFSLPIASEENGIHHQSIKTAAEICVALAENSKGGEANFRFAATANCPAGIPFFPAASHQGTNSFAIGLEYPNLITEVFKNSTWENAESRLKAALEKAMKPIESIAMELQNADWKYDGIDTSPAPGLDASIGDAIEALTQKPFGSSTTLSACAIITRVIKNLDVKTCGYSGLMLPVIEDKTLAQRATEGYYTVEELLLFSSVSGTGLDVIPISGSTSKETIEGLYRDVASLSLKYFNKPLSARLFPIPGKEAGDVVEFENPYLTTTTVMEIH